MSKTNQELETIENMRADFDDAISQDKFSDARAIVDNLGDLGYEYEALALHQVLNRAINHRAFPVNESLEDMHLRRLDEIAEA